MTEPLHALDQIQRWMQAAITHPDGVAEGMNSAEAHRQIDAGVADVEKVLTRSKAMTAVERLAIYGSAYYARLLECMREEFPATTHALGEELFDSFAAAYLQQYPSRSYTLCQLGANFPRYLVESRPPREEGDLEVSWPEFLADLAQFEWTFSAVFDGEGVEGKEILDEAKLRAVPPERWPDARLVPVCCLRLLTFRFPVQAYYAAVRNDETPEMPVPAETLLALTRRNYVVRHSTLDGLEYRLLSALVEGKSVTDAIEQVAQSGGADFDRLAANLHEWFRHWAASGFFQAVELPEAAEPKPG
ncbi:MAG TPA: hypothetical protein DDY78_07200 [Planctomycetales bacterium]|jgi:hypothetical protein|nr:hypothetical protein [Planctomycetales bacterium]